MNNANKPTILCMYSGGIDSTGVLHQLMTSEEYVGQKLIIHHIHIFNRENRAQAESIAVKNILQYYKQNYSREFLFTESVFDTMGFAPLQSNRFPFDMDICAFLAGNICAARKDIGFVAMGRTKTDVESGGEQFMKRMERAQTIFGGVMLLDNTHKPEYIFPVVGQTKRAIWESLPEKVRDNTWWCRKPVYSDHKKPKPCGKCITCNDVKKMMHA